MENIDLPTLKQTLKNSIQFEECLQESKSENLILIIHQKGSGKASMQKMITEQALQSLDKKYSIQMFEFRESEYPSDLRREPITMILRQGEIKHKINGILSENKMITRLSE